MTQKNITIGCKIPKDYFITSGIGESDISIHAGSFHLALKNAGIKQSNIMQYSSILPKIANEIKTPEKLTHGQVIETIMACESSIKGKIATAGIIIGTLYNKETNEKFGGLVCEYSGNLEQKKAEQNLENSLEEIFLNGFSKKFNLKEIRTITKSLTPKKQHGTALVALCFTTYEVPIITFSQQH